MNKKISIAIPAVIVVFIVVLLGAASWLKSIDRQYIVTTPDPVDLHGARSSASSDTAPSCIGSSLPASTDEVPGESGDVITEQDDNWNTYVSQRYKLELRFPNTWELNNMNKGVVVIASPETKKSNEENGAFPAGNIIVTVYNSLAELTRQTNDQNNPEALFDYLNGPAQSAGLISDVTETKLNKLKVYKVTWNDTLESSGSNSGYGIYLENEGVVYEIKFMLRSSRAELTSIESKILSSLKFGTPESEISTASDDLTDKPATAEDVLISFFANLEEKKYAAATTLLNLPQTMNEISADGTGPENSWEGLESFSPAEERSDKTALLKNYCEVVGTCLKAKILERQVVNSKKTVFTIQLIEEDGSVFGIGPCCGATEEGVPPQNEFKYAVVNINGNFKVTKAPPYRP